MDGGGGTGGGPTGGGGGGADVELVCKTLQFEHKLFYFDLKENPRGKYLKISEKTAANRSTIIVPSGGVGWFLELFNYYIETDEREIVSKELRLDSKVGSFSLSNLAFFVCMILFFQKGPHNSENFWEFILAKESFPEVNASILRN
jgi:PurA ssDNA and RNA-binding protein